MHSLLQLFENLKYQCFHFQSNYPLDSEAFTTALRGLTCISARENKRLHWLINKETYSEKTIFI